MKKTQKIVSANDYKIVWRALELIAAARGQSISALSRDCGMDPTSFNISKRMTHLPNISTICAVLHTANLTWADWAKYCDRADKGE